VRVWLPAAVVLLVHASAAHAQDAGVSAVVAAELVAPPPMALEPEIPRAEPPELAAADLSLGWALVRTIVVLGIVVALAYLSLNVGLRRLMGLGPAAGRRGVVTVLERVPLDQKRSLYVVKAGPEVLLLGSSELSLTFLTKLDPAVLAATPAASAGAPLMSPFLQKLLGKKEAEGPASSPPASS
jgi:flagellar protein FliO/FliZ